MQLRDESWLYYDNLTNAVYNTVVFKSKRNLTGTKNMFVSPTNPTF
jgi:hypothetical protein